MRDSLKGRVALVTGSSLGIGRASAFALAARGAFVVCNGLQDDEDLASVAMATGGTSIVGGVSNPSQANEIVGRIESQYGPVSILVSTPRAIDHGVFYELDIAGWWNTIQLNLNAAFALIQRTIQGMKGHNGGRIIVISSEAGVEGRSNSSGFAASMAGLIALAKSLGRELGPEGILVNAVAPGALEAKDLGLECETRGERVEQVGQDYADWPPIGRLGRVEEVAACVAFLASTCGSAYVGQVLQPNGGTIRCFA